MREEGTPRIQHLGESIPTLRVFHSEFDDIMIIDADTFNPKVHVRVNELGQKVDARGLVIDKEPMQPGSIAAANSKKGGNGSK